MKLIRFGMAGEEKPGVLLEDGTRLDVSATFADYTPGFFAAGGLDQLSKIVARGGLPKAPAEARLGPPIARPHKFLAIGLNYRLHAQEAGLPIPEEPVLFTKATSCICGPNDDVLIPRGSTKLDYEVELGLVMKNKVRYLESEDKAMEHVAGFVLSNDVSERNFQMERAGNWVKGKSADTFGPLGPWLVTRDEMPNYDSLEMQLKVNGETRQHSNTNDLIFGVPHIVWYLSQFMTLEPGDVIITGTPSGVALGMKPPGWLKDGDKVELTIEGLGTQTQTIRG